MLVQELNQATQREPVFSLPVFDRF